MGCQGPKSAIDVRSGETFLDLTVRQVEVRLRPTPSPAPPDALPRPQFLNSKYGVDVPLVLMNSFTTHEDTIKILAKYRDHNIRIHSFVQSCFPCLYKDTMLPVPVEGFSRDTQHAWCGGRLGRALPGAALCPRWAAPRRYPPGHGDLYNSLFESGLLESLINQGKEYLFVSNVDNLAATVDLNILYDMITRDSEFVMEVTQKTRADLQGGTLVDRAGKLTLLELPEVPKDHVKEFQSVKRFPHFNTNNLWVNLRAIQRLVAADEIDSSVFVTTRTMDHDKVLQLETAAGAAIRVRAPSSADPPRRMRPLNPLPVARAAAQSFTNPVGVLVPRARFLPVKSTSDLFLVQSNLFTVRHGRCVAHAQRRPARHGALACGVMCLRRCLPPAPVASRRGVASIHPNEDREFPANVPLVKFGPEFQRVDDYERRFRGEVDVRELDHLTVSGDVVFGEGVALRVRRRHPPPHSNPLFLPSPVAAPWTQGTVIIVANEGCRIEVPPGSVLEDKVVTGSLRVTDHYGGFTQ